MAISSVYLFTKTILRNPALIALLIMTMFARSSAQEQASSAEGSWPIIEPVGLRPLADQATIPANIKVGLLSADDVHSTVRAGLAGTGLLQSANIGTISASGATPTLAQLRSYDVVLVWTNLSFSDPVATGNVLADYVDAGGRVVMATYAFTNSGGNSWWIGGRFQNAGYSPFLVSTSRKSVSGSLNLATAPPGHPVFDGLIQVAYFQNSNYTDPPLNTDATLLARDTQNNKVVAENKDRTVVGISIFPGNNTLSTSNPGVSRLFTNALIYVSGSRFRITNSRYSTVTPVTITGTAGDTTIVRVAVKVGNGGFVNATIDSNRNFIAPGVVLLPDTNKVVAHGFTSTDSLVAADSTIIILDQTIPSFVFGPEAVGITNSQAVIVFDTDEPTYGHVALGLTPNPGETLQIFDKPTGVTIDTTNTFSDSQLTQKHRVLVFGLFPDTTYYFQVMATDEAGNSTGRRPSPPRTFRTRKAPDTIPPLVIEFPAVEGVTDSSATITAATDEIATALVQYALDDSIFTLTTVNGPTTETARHRIQLTGLNPNRLYFFRMRFTDPSGNQRTTGFSSFRTKDGPDRTPPVIRKVNVVTATTDRVVIAWETDEPADSEVLLFFLGTPEVSSKPLISTDEIPIVKTDGELTRQHLITFTNLPPGSYAFLVRSKDQAQNASESKRRTFTINPPDTTPPVLTSPVGTVYNGGYLICLGFYTDEPTIVRIDVAPIDDLTDIRSFFSSNFRVFHVVAITNLSVGRVYKFVITLTDASGNTTVFPENGFNAKTLAELRESKILFKVLQSTSGRFTTNNQPDTQAPVILNGPTISARNSNALTIAWETDELSNSVIEYGTGNFNLVETSSNFVTTHQVTLNNLSPGTSYQYRISSKDGLGNGPTLGPQPTLSATATTAVAPDISPPVISNVTVASVTNNRAIVNWTTNEIADRFVEFDSTSTGFSQILGSTDLQTGHSVTLTNLSPGKTYHYRVRSTDAAGNGPTFGATGMFTTALTADTTPPGISGVNVQPGFRSVSVSWTTSELASSFIELINSASDTILIARTNLTTTHSMTVADTTYLPAGVNTYTAIVGSIDPSGNSSQSAGQTFQTLATADVTPPSAPVGLTAVPGNAAVLLRWNRNTESDFNGYTIYRTARTDTTQIQSGIRDTSYIDISVINDSTYTYFLQAVDRAIPIPNRSGFSSAVSTTPQTATAPTAPLASAPADGDTVSLKPVLLLGNAAPGTNGGTLTYTFAVYADSGLTQLVSSIAGIAEGTTGNPTHWQVIDPAIIDSVVLQNGSRYWWRARANDGTFDGNWSAAKRFVASSSKPTGIVDALNPNVPRTYSLSQNFPNPFNPTTRISYALPSAGAVSITIYNILGQEVKTLLDSRLHEPGVYSIVWNGRNQSENPTGSGVYFYRIDVRDLSGKSVFTQAKKMLLIK